MLPTRMRGIAGDTTVFRYGSLSAGNTAGVRPTSTIGSTGVSDSVTYDGTTWNTATHRRNTEAAASVFYDVLGRADSMLDPLGTPTVTRHDRLGRVYLSRTGTGGARAGRLHALPAGRPGRQRRGLRRQRGGGAARPGSFQTTRYFFNPLGMVDSTISAGGRRASGFWRDGLGNVYLGVPGGTAPMSPGPSTGRAEWQPSM